MVPLGGHLATLAPPRGPLKGPSRKSHEKVDFWSPFGRPKGSLWGSIFGNFRDFFNVFSRYFFEVLFGRLLGSLGTPSNHENDGFVYTKPSFLHFHLYPQSDRKLPPMGTLLAPFGVQNAESGGPYTITKTCLKKCLKKVTQNCPCAPSKDSQDGRTGRPTGP